MNHRTRSLTLTLALLALPWCLESHQQTPAFRAGVDLLTLDVRVLDQQGRPLRGLRAEEFQVELDGQRRTVQALEYEAFDDRSRALSAPAPAAAPTFRPSQSEVGGRSILIGFDDLSFRRVEGRSTAQDLGRWLTTLDDRDRVGVATTSGVGAPPAWSTTREATRRALDGLVGRRDRTPPASLRVIVTIEEARAIAECVLKNDESGVPIFAGCGPKAQLTFERECFDTALSPDELRTQAIQLDQPGCALALMAEAIRIREEATRELELQIGGLTDMLRILAAAPAPRILVLVSRGLPLANPIELTTMARVAGDAGVALFVLATPSPGSASELPVKYSDLGLKPEDGKRQDDLFNLTGLETVAGATNGQAHTVVGSADRFLDQILVRTSGYYRLGVEAPPGGRPWMLVKVTTRRRGTSVSAPSRVSRPGAEPEVAEKPKSIEERLADIVRRGDLVRGMAVDLATTLAREPTGQRLQITANVRLRESRPGPLQAVFALAAEDGTIVANGRLTLVARHAQPGFRAAFHVPILPGRYQLRIAVADGQGEVGAAEREVVARLVRIGSYYAGDLVVAWSGPDGQLQYPEINEVPATAVNLRPILELYAADGKPTIVPRVRLVVEPAAGGAPILTRDMDTTLGGTMARATADLPVADLPPGDYALHALVFERDQESGRLSTSLRLPPRPR